MDRDADMGFVQINLGLTPGWGAGQRLLRLVGYSRALELLITGRIIEASEALQLGLINQVTQPGQVFNEALDFSRDIVLKPRQALYAVKRILRAGSIFPSETAATFEQAEFPPLWISPEHTQAVKKFLNRKRNSDV
jgi:enoyl-CoA hydratase